MWVEQHGKKWRIRDERGGRKLTIQGGYGTKTAAKVAMVRYAADELRGDGLVPRGGRVTLDDWLDMWWPSYVRSLKPTSVHSEGGRVRNHIRPLLGPCALDDLDSLTIQRFVDDLSDGAGPVPVGAKWRRRKLAPKTVHNVHGMLHVILNAAVAQRLIRINPCGDKVIKLPKRVRREMKFLTDPEIARLVAATPEHWRPLVMLLITTGLRWGEAVGLRVGRVDLLAARPKLIVVEHLHEMSSTGDMIFTDPKSERSRRTVSFPLAVAFMLAALVAGKEPDEMVFLTALGRMVRVRNFRRIWLAACEAAGLKGLRVHDLRHTHAGILISAGRPLSAISRRLGHSCVAVTDSLYGHLREEVDEGILAAIEDAIEDAIRAVGADALAAEVTDELTEL